MLTCKLPIEKKRTRILYVISHYQLGGAEKYTFELTQLLCRDKELAVAAILGDDSSLVGKSMTIDARRNGILVFNGVSLPWKFGGFLVAALRLRRIILEFRPDIIHLNTEIPEFTYALSSLLFNGALKNTPVVRTIHNTVLWTNWNRLGAWCERRLAQVPVVCVSGAVRESFQYWRSGCGLSEPRLVSTIYNPITVSRHRERIFNPRPENKHFRLLFAGRLEYQKGSDLLPEVLRQIKVPADAKVSLSIYGEGSDREALSKLRDSPPPGWHVQLGPPEPNLVELLHDFDILLFPSRFEGYGRLAAEAVLAGIPVVAFRLPALFEIFPSDYPWLAPFDGSDVSGFAGKVSDLLTVLGHTQNSLQDSVQDLLDSARNQLRSKLDPRIMVQDYAAFYEKLIN